MKNMIKKITAVGLALLMVLAIAAPIAGATQYDDYGTRPAPRTTIFPEKPRN